MLNQISLKNFRNHKDSILDFHGGINIISGPSDNGKSRILEAMGVVINNRPSGFPYKSHFSKKKDDTEILIQFGEDFVKRVKSTSNDAYWLSSISEPFTALNRQVPEEVKSFLNIGSYSYQEQHDPYFFVSKATTPGERAKLLNDIAGLQIIDVTKTNIKNIIKNTTEELNKVKKDIDEFGIKEKNLQWVLNADKILTEIETLFYQYTLLEEENRKLKLCIDGLKNVEVSIASKKKFLNVKYFYLKICKLFTEFKTIEEENKKLTHYINSLNNIQKIIAKNSQKIKVKDILHSLSILFGQYNRLREESDKINKYFIARQKNEHIIQILKEWLTVKPFFTTITSYINEYNILENEIQKIQEYKKQKIELDSHIDIYRKKVYSAKKDKKLYYQQFNVCPFCKREMAR